MDGFVRFFDASLCEGSWGDGWHYDIRPREGASICRMLNKMEHAFPARGTLWLTPAEGGSSRFVNAVSRESASPLYDFHAIHEVF